MTSEEQPKAAPGFEGRPPQSLNRAIRQELYYLDSAVATPFRALRRVLGSGSGPLATGLGEMIWALEGMARLPVKLLESAFGEESEGK